MVWLSGVRAPLLTWLVVMVVAGTAIWYGLSGDRARVADAFGVRTEAAADGLAGVIASSQELLVARAVDVLSGEEVSVGALRSVVLGMGFESGAVFDQRGRYISATRFREEFVGRDFTDGLEHVRIAATQGRPGVSQAVVSPSLGTAAVGISAPYPTPYGLRIVTGVLPVHGGVLDDLVVGDLSLGHTHIDVIDRDGILVASSGVRAPDELTPYQRWAPEAAAALDRAPSGDYVDSDGKPHVFSSAQVSGTDWRLVVAGDEGEVFVDYYQERSVVLWLYLGFGVLGLAAAGVSARDIRRRRAAEQQVRSLNADLERLVDRRTAALEEALRQSRRDEEAAARLASVVESAGEAIIGLDLDGTVTSWNPAAETLYGYPSNEAVGQPITLLTDPDYAAEPYVLLRRVMNGEQVSRHLTIRRARDGHRRDVEVSITPIVGANGRITGAASLHLDVTRRRSAERAGQHAVELFETIFRNGAPQGVTTLDGRFIEVNDALCELLGHDREQLLRMRVGEVTDPVDREVVRDHINQLRDGSTPRVQLRKGLVHRDGHVITTLMHLTVMRDAEGEPEAVIGLLQDITAQTQAEEQLSQREALLEGVTSSAANISTMYDTAGRCVFAAGAGLAGVGETPTSMVGTYFVERHAHDVEMMEGFSRALRGEPADVTTEFRDRCFDVRFRPVRNQTEVTHVALTGTDITARQRAQAAVALSERRFRALVQHAHDAILQIDDQGAITAASPGITHVMGSDADRLVGRSVFEIVVPDDLDTARADLEQVLQGMAIHGIVRARHASGEIRHVEYDAIDLRDDPAVGTLVATLRDVTERVEADQLRRAHAAEVEEMNRELQVAVQVRENILAATTHELRTPLTPMVGLMELMRSRWDDLDRATLRQYFDVIQRNTGRLTTLVEDLLFATSLRSGVASAVPEPLQVCPALGRALSRWPETADADVHGDDIAVWCQPDHLDQILTALVSNATRHGQPPYRVEITVDGSTVAVGVADHGPGIPDDQLATIFEPFTQGSTGDTRTATRLGLGLPIAQALARANGGDLSYVPGSTGGATFVLQLGAVLASEAPQTVLPPVTNDR